MNDSSEQQRVGVLIDADNTQSSIVDGLLAEISTHGVASVKRMYGDWTKPNRKGWKDTLLTHAIQPIRQFSFTSGKNATGSAMIIDAMDLLYSERFDGFRIVSSDSDCTRLASRTRETGLSVCGFGEKKDPAGVRLGLRQIGLHGTPSRAGLICVRKKQADQRTAQERHPSGAVTGQRHRIRSRPERLRTTGDHRLQDRQSGTGLRPTQLRGHKKLHDLIEATKLYDLEARSLAGSDRKVL